MPDGYGDGFTFAELNAPRFLQTVQSPSAHEAIARLCLHLGISRRETLRILGAKQNKQNFEWLDSLPR